LTRISGAWKAMWSVASSSGLSPSCTCNRCPSKLFHALALSETPLYSPLPFVTGTTLSTHLPRYLGSMQALYSCFSSL
jgi:hypothetical protein